MGSAINLTKEASHFDRVWEKVKPSLIADGLRIPGTNDLAGKRILVCSCGSGLDPVRASKTGAEVFAVDLSPVGVQKAVEMAAFNGVKINAQVMDLHHLAFPANFFDVLYGSAILHHLDCDRAGQEFQRVLNSGGIGFFQSENTDRNPLLAFCYRAMSRTDEQGDFKSYLKLKRQGTTNERMLCASDLRTLGRYFPNVRTQTDSFMFFQKLSHVAGMRGIGITRMLDQSSEFLVPWLRRFSYEQDVWFSK